jgi:hypothetical protein
VWVGGCACRCVHAQERRNLAPASVGRVPRPGAHRYRRASRQSGARRQRVRERERERERGRKRGRVSVCPTLSGSPLPGGAQLKAAGPRVCSRPGLTAQGQINSHPSTECVRTYPTHTHTHARAPRHSAPPSPILPLTRASPPPTPKDSGAAPGHTFYLSSTPSPDPPSPLSSSLPSLKATEPYRGTKKLLAVQRGAARVGAAGAVSEGVKSWVRRMYTHTERGDVYVTAAPAPYRGCWPCRAAVPSALNTPWPRAPAAARPAPQAPAPASKTGPPAGACLCIHA